MKKFVSVLLAVIIALSVSVVAFAEAESKDYFCEICQANFNNEKQYIEHVRTGCLEQYKKCPYCDATIHENDIVEHQKECPKGAGSCKYCGDSYDTEGDFDKHLETDCWVVGLVGKDVADFILKVIDFLKGVDWEGLFNKVSDVVSGIDLGGIVDTIKPIFEKIIGFIGEKVELPAL